MREMVYYKSVNDYRTQTLFLLGFLLFSNMNLWSQETEKVDKSCIDRIMKGDEKFGKIRNHDPEKMPVDQAISIYVQNIRSMDYTNCPPRFIELFHAHVDAWQDLVPYAKPFAELRGEMHDVFNQIEQNGDSGEFKAGVDKIWETWGLLEEWMKNNEN